MQRLFAIIWLTWKAAFRFRLFLVVAVLLLLAVVGLPLLIEDDGARGFTQILLIYTLSTIAALLGLSTLWLACGTLARDIEDCQMQMVAVKPIPRWQIADKQLQGHSGTISECRSCHAAGSLPLTLRGPHGMHNVGDANWTTRHESFAESNLQVCAACHGADFRGTALSRTADVRTWNTEYGTRTVPKGRAVGCYDCHNGPYDD